MTPAALQEYGRYYSYICKLLTRHMFQKQSEAASFPMTIMLEYVYKRGFLKCVHILINIAHPNALPISVLKTGLVY